VLRFTEKADEIVHIPKILYHWRKAPGSAAAIPKAKPYAYEAAKKALTDALPHSTSGREVILEATPGFCRVRRELISPGKVTIINTNARPLEPSAKVYRQHRIENGIQKL